MTAAGSLLIAEPPLIVLPSLAVAVGLNEAIVLQQVFFRSLKHADDEGWVQRTRAGWKSEFPFWHDSTIKRTWASLREQGLIETEIVTTDDGREGKVRIVFEAVTALTGGSGQIDPMGRVRSTRPVGSDRPDPHPLRAFAGASPAAKAAGDAPRERERESPTASVTSRRQPDSRSWRPEVVALAERFAAGMRRNDERAKVAPSSRAWLDPLRKLLDVDDRPVAEVEAVIDWVQRDGFESTVVLSPGKLRDRFTGLRGKALAAGALAGVDGAAAAAPVPRSAGGGAAERARQLREQAAAERAGGDVIDGREASR